MEVISQRGAKNFKDNGYLFTFDKKSASGDKFFWRCDGSTGEGVRCKARIHTVDGAVVKRLNVHCHGSDAAKVVAEEVKTALKKKAVETMEQPSQIINNCVAGLPESVKVALPNIDALKKTVRRARNIANVAPPAPLSAEDLVIPPDYQVYKSAGMEEPFLLGDSGPTPNRILIFGRNENLNVLASSNHWFIDGTFRSSPAIFFQIYIIMAKVLGGVLPMVYALLPNKQGATYAALIGMLKNLRPNLNPGVISCDFELAAVNAFKDAFPNVEIQGCFFHLTKNLRKHLGNLHLLSRYNNDPDFALQARMITSLAFVPIHRLDDAVDQLAAYLPAELQQVLEWFEDFYMGRMNRTGNGRRPPIFSPDLWSVYNRVMQGLDRTNNHVEAAHRRLQVELSSDHPTIWCLIDILRKVQGGRDMYYQKLLAGFDPVLKLKKYRDADVRIVSIVRDFENRTIINYLKGGTTISVASRAGSGFVLLSAGRIGEAYVQQWTSTR